MPEVTYISQVECQVVISHGMVDSQVIKVPDEENRGHTLRVAQGSLVEHAGRSYLPVGLVHVDYKGRRALVELPEEADSGTSRVWVPFARLRRQENGA